MQNRKSNQAETSPKSEFAGLPAHSIMHQLITISQKLIDLGDKETQCLLQNDMLAFAILQYEKETLTNRYVAISEEFRSRLEEFRHIDKTQLNRLEKLQRILGEKSHSNNAIIKQIQIRAEKSTQKTLLAAQEIAQSTFITFSNGHEQSEQKEGI